MTEKERYNIKLPYLPCCNNWKFSQAKAEKVVKPPHIPVTKNNRQLLTLSVRSVMPIKMPINKQPMILTVSVANGKDGCLIAIEAIYLNMVPIIPPNPTMQIFLNNMKTILWDLHD